MTDAPDRFFEVRLVPPSAWRASAPAVAAPRLRTLEGATVALLANGKANGDLLLEEIAHALTAGHGVRAVLRHTKPHPSLPVDDEVLMLFAEHAHAVLSAIGD